MYLRVLIVIALIASSRAYYEESPFVVELTVNNFEDEVLKKNDLWIVQFFSTNDDKCLKYSDEYEKVAKALDGFVKVGAVDVDRDRLLAYRYDVMRLPTLIYIHRDKTFTKHKGPKKAQDFVNLAVKLVEKAMNDTLVEKYIDLSFVRELTEVDIEKQVKVGGRWLVAYVREDSPSDDAFKTTFSSVAERLQDNIKFGYHKINTSNNEIESTPSIAFYFGRRNNRSELFYDGLMEINEVITWTMTNVKRPEVIEMQNEEVLKETCMSKRYCIIALLSTPSNCDKDCKKEFKETLTTLAEEYKYYSSVWALVRKNDMPTLEEIFGINSNTEFPTLLVINVQTLKSKELEEFNLDKAREFLEDLMHGSGFPEYRLPGFDNLLQEHYKPWRDEL